MNIEFRLAWTMPPVPEKNCIKNKKLKTDATAALNIRSCLNSFRQQDLLSSSSNRIAIFSFGINAKPANTVTEKPGLVRSRRIRTWKIPDLVSRFVILAPQPTSFS